MPDFELVAPFGPTGDQPQAIEQLVGGVREGKRHQVLLGATGTGKSLEGSEPILIGTKQPGGEVSWSLDSIGSMVDKVIDAGEPVVGADGTQYLPADRGGPRRYVSTIDPRTLRPVVRRVTEYSRHRAPSSMWRVATTDGRKVRVTGDHNFVRLGPDLELEVCATSQIRPGDLLPLPARTPTPTEPVNHVDFASMLVGRNAFLGHEPSGGDPRVRSNPPRVPLDGAAVSLLERADAQIMAMKGPQGVPALAELHRSRLRLIGLFIAEGHVASDYATITPGPEGMGITRDLLAACETPFFERSPIDLGLGSRIVADTFRELCGERAGEKHLPSFWPELSDRALGDLLAGYFEGDGWVEGRGASVCAVTRSRRLTNELAYALLRFGIVARIARTWKRAVGTAHEGAWYWQLSIRGAEDIHAFEAHVGFLGERKRRQLREISRRVVGGNADALPGWIGPWFRRARVALGVRERDVADRVGCSRTALDFLELGQRSLRRGTATSVLRALRELAVERDPVSPAMYLDAMAAVERVLACRWATVKSVEETEPLGEHVYDVSVEDTETFLAGFGGLVVHNTFAVSQVIAQVNKPTLVLAHNKTLAAQLYSEFRDFFPDNAVEYFVSYFDYYQPEAYLPRSDTYIEKDSSRNDEIDKLRHAATRALFERRDVIIVASVSCIYGLGAPVDYGATVLRLRTGGRYRRDGVLRQLVDLQYSRNDQALSRAKFRVRGDTLELQPAYDDFIARVEFFGDEVERVTELDPLTGEVLAERNELNVYPASHYVTPQEKMVAAIEDIDAEMDVRVAELEQRGMVLEAERLRQRTTFDLEMMRELGFCSGIENYSRHLARREAGSRPWTLLDYFPPDWLLVIDESHMTIPQVAGMYKNDRTRKEILVDFGFRLPSALDNRPLTFEEFEAHLDQVVHMSATPGPWELQRAEGVVEQLIRPTGIVDPTIEVRPTEGQIDDLIDRIKERVERGERVLATTLTKRMAEDLADYLHEMGIRVSYLHSEVDTLERVQILRDLRLGVYDVLVGINLLREGIDLPEVTLVAILDADKEGFLRSAWSLIQVIGRAARNTGGEVVMYADRVTESMQVAIDETNRRRSIQEAYNEEHGIEPQTIVKEIRDINDRLAAAAEPSASYGSDERDVTELSTAEVEKLVSQLEAEMKNAAKQLEFERAAALRDEIQDIRIRVLEQDASVAVLKQAERAAAGADKRATPTAKPSERAAARKAGERRGRREATEESALEVTEVKVLPAGEEPVEIDEGTAADVFPGIKDAHEDDDEGWMARWLDKPTWDRRVTPNVIKRTGQRPRRRR